MNGEKNLFEICDYSYVVVTNLYYLKKNELKLYEQFVFLNIQWNSTIKIF